MKESTHISGGETVTGFLGSARSGGAECRVVSFPGTEDWDVEGLAAAAGSCTVFTAKVWSKGLADDIAEYLGSRTVHRWAVVTDEPEGWLAIVIPARTDAPTPHCLSWRVHNSPIRRLSREMGFTQPVRALRRHPEELRQVGAWIGQQSDPGTAIVQHWPQLSWWGRRVVPPHEWIWREPWMDGKDAPQEAVDVRAIVQHHHDHAGPWGGTFSESSTVGVDGCPNVVLNVTARGDGRALPGARDRASGKGRTVQESAASAVGECTERRAITAPAPWLRTLRNNRMQIARAGLRTLEFHELEPFSEAQWLAGDAINATGHAHYKVPANRPDDDTVLDWVEGEDLATGETVMLPLDHLYYRPGRARSHFVPDTNGAAAGRSREDAIERGLRELAERDAWCQWWYGKERKPAIPLDVDPQCLAVEKALAGHGRTLHLLDLTLNPMFPVVMAVGALAVPLKDGPAKGGNDLIHGAGCAPTFAEAARRAVGEVIQCAMLGSDPAKRLAFHLNDPAARIGMGWNRDTAPWNWPDPDQVRRGVDPATPEDGWLAAYARMARAGGHALIVHDMTPGFRELPVWKAVAPFFRHFWPRLAHPRWPTSDGTTGNVPVWL